MLLYRASYRDGRRFSRRNRCRSPGARGHEGAAPLRLTRCHRRADAMLMVAMVVFLLTVTTLVRGPEGPVMLPCGTFHLE